MPLSIENLTNLVLDMTSGISKQDRFNRLLHTLRNMLKCDALALLRYEGEHFMPLAIEGLSADVLGRRFLIREHPRLEAIARAGDVVRFPADSALPDPYDGLIPNRVGQLKVHACVALPLLVDNRLIGAVTLDDFDPDKFDGFTNDALRTISALAAASLNSALLMEQLDDLASQGTWGGKPVFQTDTEMIGQSPSMVALKNEIDIVANSDLNVLILGETGVGKELVAKSIHKHSPRADKALIYLNCAALPNSVAESELFGHIKGAFTGAISNRKGKFELADGGVLFLDEVGELSLELQAKLLRVIQYGDIQRVGDDSNLQVDVRIVAATNKDLKQAVIDGNFRADLFHRLSIFPLQVPPLRERTGDIALLAGFFAEKCRSKLAVDSVRFSAASIQLLNDYDWPGNVRELEHAIHRAGVLARAMQNSDDIVISPDFFNLLLTVPSGGPSQSAPLPTIVDNRAPLKQAVQEFQAHYVSQALADNGQNWAAAARQLGVDSGNLHRLAKKLGLKGD